MTPARRTDTESGVLDHVRRTVRALLERSPEYRRAPRELRRDLAANMVRVSMAAAKLLEDDAELTKAVRAREPPIAGALAAGQHLGMQATRAAAGVIADTRRAIDFPGFVTDLINSVFRAMTTSNMQQLEAYADLLKNVSASADDFASTNVTDDAAITWLLGRFSLFRATSGSNGGSEIALREGVDLFAHTELLKSALDADDGEVAGIDGSDLRGTLLPLARRKMGRDRQQVLATMVMMGLQRVVVDKGQLHASMDLRVDTRSAAQQDVQDRSDFRLNAGASASFGIGMWGASANMSTSVGHVHSDQQYTDEQIALRAGLRSSVDLVFRTEQVPLDRLADQQARDKIAGTTFQPAAWTEGSLLPSDRAVTTTRVDAAPTAPAPPTAPTPPGRRDAQPAQPPGPARPPAPRTPGTTTRPAPGQATAPRTPTTSAPAPTTARPGTAAPTSTTTAPPGTTVPPTATVPPGTTPPPTATAPPGTPAPTTTTTAQPGTTAPPPAQQPPAQTTPAGT